jgi:hypothetical protein
MAKGFRSPSSAVVGLLALLASDAALAQQQRQTFKDANGRTLGRLVTDSCSTRFYDSFGRNTGRAVTDSRGNTSFYDSMGRNTGRPTTNGNTTITYDNHRRQEKMVMPGACRTSVLVESDTGRAPPPSYSRSGAGSIAVVGISSASSALKVQRPITRPGPR